MLEAKLVARAHPTQKTIISIAKDVSVGGNKLLVIGGPCSVESLEQMETVAHTLARAPVQMLRGGVFKPRTSPYSFQGLGEEGLAILATIRRKYGIPLITEVMAIEQIGLLSKYTDVLQIGSRNMQNFDLLKAVGRATKPVMLKRGLAATLEELLLAAEYIVSHGNKDVILCERGIRSFDNHTRNVLDLGGVVALKELTHLPIVVDPSHACGKREYVADLAMAAVACGADGIMVECHPQPEKSVSDARQALSLEEMIDLVARLRMVAKSIGRSVDGEDRTEIRTRRGVWRQDLTPVA